ncbi:MAG: DNA primase [Fimbriimonadaceae bacterium]|nr:DNA primase [Fimbriimonadaceae bacterium]
MADERDDIRARINIVDLVSERVNLRKSGKNWTGLCPFHDDKNPSFNVSPGVGRYRCWSCGAAGDIFDWVMNTQNVEFGDALKILADRAGIELKRGAGPSKSVRKEQVALMEEALAFFQEMLSRTPEAIAYCENRGLTEAVLKEWEIGYAPTDNTMLASRLGKAKLNLAMGKELFLVDGDPNFGYRDKFTGRLMIPIRDERGELVAFGGRIIGDGIPKYINSSDTPLYRKSRVLYGMNKAKEVMSKSRKAVLVEGYLDVIACHRAGVTTAIASLGTSLAEDHAALLKRWVDQVTILYDSDTAGQKAADRSASILQEHGIKVRVALMPPGEDPDTLLRTAGAGAVMQAAERGITPTEFRLKEVESKIDPNSDEFWETVAQVLIASKSLKEVERHVTELAAKYLANQPERSARTSIFARIEQVRRAAKQRRTNASSVPVPVQIETKTLTNPEAVVCKAFVEDDLRSLAWRAIVDGALGRSSAGIAITEAIRSAFPDEAPVGHASQWLHKVEPEELRVILSDTESDPLLAQITLLSLQTTVAHLKKDSNRSELRELKASEPSDEKLKKIQEKLEQLKNP